MRAMQPRLVSRLLQYPGARGMQMAIAANPCNFGIIENHWRTAAAGAYPTGNEYLKEVADAGYHATDLVI